MTDDIQKVREAYEAALEECSRFSAPAGTNFYAALAKRLQPCPAPEKKVWRVSAKTLENFNAAKALREHTASILGLQPPNPLDDVAPDIIRERPDLVAAEWERRMRDAAIRDRYVVNEFVIAERVRGLFPELDP